MLGYIYLTELEAQNARLACDNHYGYPKTGCDTLHWVNYQFDGNIYYIVFDESVREILGEPTEFIITE